MPPFLPLATPQGTERMGEKGQPISSATVYAFSLDLSWTYRRIGESHGTSPELELVMSAFLYPKDRVGTNFYEVP